MKKRKLVIIHFEPLERFPPVMNLLDYLIGEANKNIIVISTEDKKGSNLKKYENAFIKIIRTPAIVPGTFFRLFNYVFFYLYSLWILIWREPAVVLYFETLSSWPA
ncbi:MAG TPA: hypothetical protein VFI29_06770, partial [Hanamia sp.]|nr:hypothetical protein [Hanamia sp.]